jgi:hypothetical protein
MGRIVNIPLRVPFVPDPSFYGERQKREALVRDMEPHLSPSVARACMLIGLKGMQPRNTELRLKNG